MSTYKQSTILVKAFGMNGQSDRPDLLSSMRNEMFLKKNRKGQLTLIILYHCGWSVVVLTSESHLISSRPECVVITQLPRHTSAIS